MRYIIYIFFVVLTACASDPFPAQYIYNVDVKKKVCDEFIITDQENLKMKFNKAIEYNQCPAVFGFTSKDTSLVLDWMRRNKKKLEACREVSAEGFSDSERKY